MSKVKFIFLLFIRNPPENKMTHTISNATRNEKNRGYDPEEALERWINEMMEVYNVPREEIVNLAIVKLERERIEKLGFQA